MRIRPAAAHLFVGADAHIGPTECTIFTKIFGEFAASQRADVGIAPTLKWEDAFVFAAAFRKKRCILRADRIVRPYRDGFAVR